MIKKILINTTLILGLITTTTVNADDDVAKAASISIAAGEVAAAAAAQMTVDAGLVSTSIATAKSGLIAAATPTGIALDVSIAQAQSAMAFVETALAAGDLTAATQAMSLVEGVAGMALGTVEAPAGLDMAGVDFTEEFSPAEMAALSSVAGQMGVGKVMDVQKMAGQMAAVEKAGFDTKGMMGALDAQGVGIGTAIDGLAKAGMVDMAALGVSGVSATAIGTTFEPASFASMNVAEMGMAPNMMAGAL